MEENKPTDPADYAPGLKKVRSRRWFLWLVIMVYLPAMMVALDSPDYKTWVTIVFSTWIVLLIIAVVFACLVRCPRCGECFHTHGPTFLPFRRCLHCALHVNADKRAPEAEAPKAKYGKKK
ncbi:MAG: hypothetical protein OQL18_09440 [Deltaproteobacteria bacterium]|nr:hypothetical protein [Deltaproteobacteria bacterium]